MHDYYSGAVGDIGAALRKQLDTEMNKPNSNIQQAMIDLAESISEAYDRISKLTEAISPVLGTVGPEDPNKDIGQEGIRPKQAELLDAIQTQASRVRDLSRLVNSLLLRNQL